MIGPYLLSMPGGIFQGRGPAGGPPRSQPPEVGGLEEEAALHLQEAVGGAVLARRPSRSLS
ncbi:MAG: hypothetical protein MZV64_44015 [Ignavibacteriales bacterium]|nr:hypothetical protein [Ignavibacteriales bacterium]